MRKIREITVGPAEADVVGSDNRAIQIAIDALWARGGGTVHVLPGTYIMKDAAHLRPGVSLVGGGPDTVLKRTPGFVVPMKIDADYGQLKVTPVDLSGFEVGMGIALADKNASGGWAVSIATITEIKNGSLYLNAHLVKDYSADNDGQLRVLSSVVSAIDVEDIRIASLRIDGSGDENPFIDGCRGGGIYLQRVKRCCISECVVKNFNGDGVSFQTTQDITVENCELAYNKNFGAHPGTGSARCIIRNCHLHHNDNIGLFLCWRVQEGKFEQNRIHHNGKFGISIGHKDTDNLFFGNTIRFNGRDGVYFRNEKESNAGHCNTFKQNIIEDNGGAEHGCGIHIDGPTRDLVFESNIIRETRAGAERTQRHAIYISKLASCTENSNVIEGHINEPVRNEMD